jgi:hypothetical protein
MTPSQGKSLLNFQIFSDDNELNQIQEEQGSVDITEIQNETKQKPLGENVINIGTLKENLEFLKQARQQTLGERAKKTVT